MMIMLDRCMGEDFCLDEQQAKNWLKGRFIVISANRIIFNPSKLNEESFSQEQFEEWIPIMTSAQVDIPYQVQKSESKLQDGYFSLDEHTEIEDDSLFTLSRQQMRAFEMQNSTIMVISFELDSDLRVIEREYETIF